MVQDRLNEAVLRRLKELGLPQCLMDLGEFRENFLRNRWVMFVRDGDKLADVHLVQPKAHSKSYALECGKPLRGARTRA